MKVLWISATIFTDENEKQSGVWQKALALELCKLPEVELFNISFHNNDIDVAEYQLLSIKQWGLRKISKNKKGMPHHKTCSVFRELVSNLNPDIIHVWGSENPFKLLPFEATLPGIKILSMQGVLSAIAENLLNGLSIKELLSTIGLREIIKRESLFTEKKSFVDEGRIEHQMIKNCNYIVTQSEWTESQIRDLNPQATYFRIQRVLRREFLNAQKWTDFEHISPIVYSASIGFTLKGLHTLVKAMAVVKKVYPDVELRLAGLTGRTDILGEGYLRLIHKMIKTEKLENNIKWLGAITGTEICKNLQQASVFVNPSFIESYSLVLAEALTIGTPSVISHAGAMPELAENNKEALFFTPGDYKSCAQHIIKLIGDRQLSNTISLHAQQRAALRNNDINTAQRQLDIYKEVLKSETKSIS